MLTLCILTLPFLCVVGINALYSKWWNGTISVRLLRVVRVQKRPELCPSPDTEKQKPARFPGRELVHQMNLSEAIRLNEMMKPQGRGPGSMVSIDAPCALGGALQSIGKQPKKWHWYAPENELLPVPTAIWAKQVVADNWPFTLRPAECPCGSDHGITDKVVFNLIVMLNDVHGWTRTQIADWVATVEPAEPLNIDRMMEMVDAVLNEAGRNTHTTESCPTALP